jgi:hypothetical protein
MSNVTAMWVDENAFPIPNLGDQGTALLGVAFTENAEQVLLHQVFNYVRVGRHRVVPPVNDCL